MYRALLFVVAAAAFGAASQPVRASNCSTDSYDHNGSVMEAQICDGGSLTISYVQPRQGMINEGARNGSLLFDGVQQANGQISGQARLFSARCGVVPYTVNGSNRNGAIILDGVAPIRDRNCRVTSSRNDHLVFTLRGGGGPQTVAPSCPAGFVFSNGQCVRGGAPAPSCPPGFFFSNGQCVAGGAPAPVPPVASGGDWYAIAGSFPSQGQAQARANQLGGVWHAKHTSQCPNMTPGLWITTAGGFDQATAQGFAGRASQFGAYAKRCNR